MNVEQESESHGKSQQVMASERTDLAQRRTLLAEERTYSAWVRTGLASMATGFAIAKLLNEDAAQPLVKAVGITFILVGVAMYVVSFLAYRQALERIASPTNLFVPTWVVSSLTFALVLGGLATLALLFF